MEFIAHLNTLLAQAPVGIRQQFDAAQVQTIATMANNDRFLGKKISHMRGSLSDTTVSPDARIDTAYREYQEALAYISISKEF